MKDGEIVTEISLEAIFDAKICRELLNLLKEKEIAAEQMVSWYQICRNTGMQTRW